VAELVDALDSGSSDRKIVGVRLSPTALFQVVRRFTQCPDRLRKSCGSSYVLTRPKLRAQARLTFEDVAKIRVGLQQFAETVPGAYRDVDAVPTDPRDNPVVATALEAGGRPSRDLG
jgi:hypothetical protein